jgi:glycosyltransferase involved in cell wall biosynthesis
VRIALLGTRGIPARYGGFETFAEELGRRLVARGHEVRVYCRQPHPAPTYLGVDLVRLPTIRHKYFDTLAHTFFSTLHLLFHRVDAVLYCNAANAIFTWLPRMAGMPVALNVDGLERKRRKWNRFGRAWYRISEKLSTWFPNRTVTDAAEIQVYYRETYRHATTMIPYGAEPTAVPSRQALDELSVQPHGYFLYVSRLEPENNALLVRRGFETTSIPMPLVLVGDAPYADSYIRQIRDTRDPRMIIPGAIYGTGYAELQSHCFAYIHATEVGGTHPALIEAMGRGALVLYLDTPENREVAGGAGIAFTPDTLPDVLRTAFEMPEGERQRLGQAAQARVRERYSWDAITDAYEKLFEELCAAG